MSWSRRTRAEITSISSSVNSRVLWAKLAMVRHHLLTPQQVKDGMRIDAPSTYENLGEFQHRLPPRPSEPAPAGGAP